MGGGFNLFYYGEKNDFEEQKFIRGAKPCNGRTDNMCSKNLFSLMRVLSLEVFLQQAFFFCGKPGDSNLLLNGLAISLEPCHGNILKLIWFKILR